MKSLFEIFSQHKGKLSDKWSIYITEYDRLFSIYRDQPVRMLEIGIQNGGSLEIWSKYFHNGMKFIGADINPGCFSLHFDNDKIFVVVDNVNTDAAQAEILQHSAEFDIVIDDGSHASSDIIKSFSRYFSRIVDGGIFVVEDLHCSYWKEFEGGLYEPYSSIAFFKRLADIINYEHWGLDNGRRDLLASFEKHYECEFDNEQLAHIHSIEFINSICVITKASPEQNVLGRRLMSGRQEDVVPGHVALNGDLSVPLNQMKFGSDIATMPVEDHLIKSLEKIDQLDVTINELSIEIARYRDSLSWKVTAPLRYIRLIMVIVVNRVLLFFK